MLRMCIQWASAGSTQDTCARAPISKVENTIVWKPEIWALLSNVVDVVDVVDFASIHAWLVCERPISSYRNHRRPINTDSFSIECMECSMFTRSNSIRFYYTDPLHGKTLLHHLCGRFFIASMWHTRKRDQTSHFGAYHIFGSIWTTTMNPRFRLSRSALHFETFLQQYTINQYRSLC